MGVKSERGSVFQGSQFGGTFGTPGFTTSAEVLNIIPANTSIHTVLTKVAAAEAIIGIASFVSVSQGTRNFGGPESWAPLIYCGDLRRAVVGFSVSRGAAKGYWAAQFWD